MNINQIVLVLFFPIILLIDYLVPRGYSVWVLYSIPFLFFSFKFYQKIPIFWGTTISLIWIGFFISTPGVPLLYSFVNRITATLLFSIIAVTIFHLKKQEELSLSRLNKALDQKTTLLKEIHHRVKNNLQIISSLLSLQSSYLENEEIRKIFLDYRNRIRSMALVHEKIYRKDDEKFLNIKDYINDLSFEIVRSYYIDEKIVKLNLDVDSYNFSVDKVILLGLLLTELITNSLKYAFGNKEGEIFISLKVKDNLAFLLYKDSGRGLNSNIKLEEPETLGLTLIKTFSEQLEGKHSFQNINGFQYECSFTLN